MKKHESMRGYFAFELLQQMKDNKDIILLLGDLGYMMFDKHRELFPNRVINTGAAEQAMMDMAVGLAYEGKIPVVYSITPFLLCRPFETIRTYINHEKISNEERNTKKRDNIQKRNNRNSKRIKRRMDKKRK